jgi:hypothetical protein
MKKNKFIIFLSSSVGKWVLTLVFALIIWGALFGIANTGSDAGIISFYLILAFFGWRALNRIQPSMFLWLSWTGWLAYFMIKFVLSVLIGVIVAPYQIGKFIAEKINEVANDF